MASRKAMLALSFLFASLVHLGLYAVAPRIALLRANSAVDRLTEVFRVKLSDEVVPPKPKPVEHPQSLVPRPGSIDDLLRQEQESLPPPASMLKDPVEVPRMAERIAAGTVERQHDLEQDEVVMRKVDARIIEIAESVARRDIEVVRRLVRPSPSRVIQKGEYPSLRGEGGSGAGEVLAFAPRPSSPKDGPAVSDDLEAERLRLESERPSFEEGVLNPELLEPGLPELPIETIVAKQPVQEAIREESPYEFIDDLVDIELDTYIGHDGADSAKGGFFRLRIVPKEGETIQTLPKDVTFVVDASNSIMQRKLVLTARGIEKCIAMLRPEDRFNIVVFRDTPTRFRQVMVSASAEAKAAARTFLDGLESRGETDVYNAIRSVIQEPPRAGIPGIVFLMSDGRPTTGVVDGREIINALTEDNVHRNSIYAFGGGRTVNRYLLDLLAYRNKGQSHVTRRMDDIDEELPRFFKRFNDPILGKLTADYGRIDEDSVFPKEIPDFYRGRAVTVFGRFTPGRDNEFVMRLDGTGGGGRKELVFKADFGNARKGGEAIARNWAFQKIYYLIGEIGRVGETPELLAQLRQLSSDYGIKTSYSK